MRCGHCKGNHDTVDEVKKCYNVEYVEGKKSDKPSGMSPNQQKYLSDLLGTLHLELTDGLTPETISYEQGRPILTALIEARREKMMGNSFSLPKGVLVSSNPKKGKPKERVSSFQRNLPDVPEGYYAVPDWTGKEEFKFFRVKRPDKGEWAGYTFVDHIIGGHPEYPARGKFIADALKAILDFGPEDAGMLYGIKIKQCCRCNRSLTKKASRALSLGRHCAYERGHGEEWDDLNYQFDDADADNDD